MKLMVPRPWRRGGARFGWLAFEFGKGIGRGDGWHVVGRVITTSAPWIEIGDRRGDDAAMAVIDLGDVVQGQRSSSAMKSNVLSAML